MGLANYAITFVMGTIFGLVSIVFVLFNWPQNSAMHPLPKEHSFKAGAAEENDKSGLDAYKAGWLIVSAQDDLTSELEVDDVQYDELSPSTADDLSNPIPPLDKPPPSKQKFYGILKHGNLFLYKDEAQKDVKQVVVLSHHFVSMWPRGTTDALLFTKTSRIAIIDPAKTLTDPNLSLPAPSVYIHTEIASEKEDWYLALVRSTKDSDNPISHTISPEAHASTLQFKTTHMMSLIQNLHSTEGQLHTRWLNALLGRMFLSLQQTDTLQNYLYTKIQKKLQKIKKPAFLDEFIITSIDPGTAVPAISFPLLREISPLGKVVVAAAISYKGGLAIEVSTKANLGVLGSRLKNRDVDVVLRITLNSLEGPILVKMKPPPSARLWYTFEKEPIMSLTIEPVVRSRQLSFNIITNSIEKKLKEGIRESIVLPHWDDIAFYDTTSQVYRAGIWETAPSFASAENTSPSSQTPSAADSLSDTEVEVIGGEDKTSLKGPKPIHQRKVDLAATKAKIANTINDITKRVQKSKTSDSVASTLGTSSKTTQAYNSFKKMNKWYYKEEKTEPQEVYAAPEMISNRRIPRKLSSASFSSMASVDSAPLMAPSIPSYDFSKSSPINKPMTRPRNLSMDQAKFDVLPEFVRESEAESTLAGTRSPATIKTAFDFADSGDSGPTTPTFQTSRLERKPPPPLVDLWPAPELPPR